MKTGKHAGTVITVLDMPGIVRRSSGSTVEILIPGLEGVGTIVTAPDSHLN